MMGHAHLGNISHFVISYLYAKGQVSTQSTGFGFAEDRVLNPRDKEGNRLWKLFYNIKWRFCKGQRNRYKVDGSGVFNYDHIGSVTH